MRTFLLLPLAAAALATPAATQRTLTPGQMTGGSLSAGDPQMNGRYFDEYTVHARRGETLDLRMGSESVDAYLYLYHDGREVARDDDGGEGTDARLRHTVREDGSYRVRATSARRDTGPYMIALETGGGWGDRDERWDDRDDDRWDRRAGRNRLRAGRPVHDFLSADDPRLDNGARYHLYRYHGRRGERITVDLSSHDFDAYLVLGLAGGRHGIGEVLERDDDSGGHLDARIRFTLPHDGEYVIRVNPMDGGTGRYLLELRSDLGGRDDWDRRPEVDERLAGRWSLFDADGRGRGTPRGVLSIDDDGRYHWEHLGRVRRGRLVPLRGRGEEYLMEGAEDDVMVSFVQDGGRGQIRLVRRGTGRVIARGFR